MAKESGGTLKLTIPTALLSALLAVGGMTGFDRFTTKSAQSVQDESQLEFVAIRQDFRNHCEQQNRDWEKQAVIDRDQNANLDMQTQGLTTLQSGQAVVLERTETIQKDIGILKSSIEKLLSRPRTP
jgi:hypothetical protein